jgi:hypothetical protein
LARQDRSDESARPACTTGGVSWRRVESEGVVILAILDAALVAMFFVFRVLPWAKPGPWRLIWIIATLAVALFSLGEASAMVRGGTAVSFEVQGPLFGAILATTTRLHPRVPARQPDR